MAPKKPKHNYTPNVGKIPHGKPLDATFLVWSFTLLDHGHPKWCFSRSRAKKITAAFRKLGNMETMTQEELARGGSHFIPVKDLNPEAIARLSELKLDDIDEVYSCRLEGICRVFAIRQNSVMRILWWDTNHEICPSRKKNT